MIDVIAFSDLTNNVGKSQPGSLLFIRDQRQFRLGFGDGKIPPRDNLFDSWMMDWRIGAD